jgi:pyrroloquinoline-quinone synthase
MNNNLLHALDRILSERNLLKHPFYQAWTEGKLTREMLAEYACQYYHFVREFPRMVSAVHSNTPDISVREPILHNLMDEELGAENHPLLWMRFANALGTSKDRVEQTEPLPTTQSLVDTMMKICRNKSFQEGLASLYAYEAQVPEISRVKIQGLKEFYGLTDPDAIKFFSVHQEADVYHSQSEKDLIIAQTPAAHSAAVENAASDTAHALWRFLDGVHESYVVPAGVC